MSSYAEEDAASKQYIGATPTAPPATASETHTPATELGVSSIMNRWKIEDSLRRSSIALRGLALIFSLLAFLIMATNKHGGWKTFDKYEEFRYVLAIAILSTLYSIFQICRQVHELLTGRLIFQMRTLALVDFFGDQVLAYLLLSAASSAVPMTNRMRQDSDNIFTDSLAAAISMSFFAFFSLASSAIISSYKLFAQS